MTKRISADEYQKLKATMAGKPAKEGRVKGTKRTEVGGIKFDSALEARRYIVLKASADMGQIKNLRRQVPIVLQGRDGPLRTPTGRPMQYVADFAYIDRHGVEIVEDAKGIATDTYKMKKAILAAQGITIREFKK